MSAIAKHDPVGRNPRRKVFALEGLAISETGGGDDEVECTSVSGGLSREAMG